MAENRGCCQCCCSFITTLGLTAFFLWLSLRASNPKCYIERFYIPALNNTLNSYKSNTTTTTPSNATIYFNLKLANPNKDKGVYYDAINLTILYLPPNATATATALAAADGGNYSVIGNKTIPGFHQGHKKTAHRKDQSVEPRGVDWKAVYGAVLNNKTVVYRVNLTTKVRFKIIFWKTKRYKINVGANVEVNDLGIKVNKKAIRLKSGAPQLGCYRAHVVALVMWWKDLDFASKLPFGRDRVVECYFWILGVYFEPEYYLARRILTKVIAMISYLDDIYDVYGTIDELELFTEAIERCNAIDHLPEYMKIYYGALLGVYREIEGEMEKEGRSYRLYYAKEAMKNQARAYFEEAKWLSKGYVPTMEEYMRVALVTSAYTILSTTSLVGMGDIVTKETFEWVFNRPKIVKASEIICRLMDDIVSHKFEQKRGHCASGIECYMSQYGVSEGEVREEFLKQVVDAWKDINKECLKPTAVPMPILMRVLNLTRVIDVVYKEEDGYTHADVILKDSVSSLLIDPVPI